MSYKIGNIKITYMNLIYWIFGITMVVPLLKQINSSAEVLSYIPDLLNILLFFLAIISAFRKNREKHSAKLVPILFVLFLFLFDAIGWIFFKQSVWLFLWGFRNNYRFILFFVSVMILCKKEDTEDIYNFFVLFLKLNFFIVLVEFLLGYRQDRLSGSFGIEMGTNGSANLFLCICLTSLIVDFFHKKITTRRFVIYCFGILIWAALAELKYFFILAAFIVALTILSVKGKKMLNKKIKIIVGGLVIGLLSIQILYLVFPYYSDFFSIEHIMWYAQHIDMGVGGYGRLTAIPVTNKIFFGNDILKEIFGIGVGNAEYSSLSIFESEFHQIFRPYNYGNVYYGMIYIERGIIGLVWYAAFCINSIKTGLQKRKTIDIDDRALAEKTIILGIIAFFICIYDDSLRRAFGGYAIFFVLAVPYILRKESEYDT